MSAVRLVSITQNAEEHILFCARVSSDQSNDDPALLRFLIRQEHWSPFEMAHIVMEVRTSRMIAPQILRHRSFSFQEFSQRYAPADRWIVYAGRRQAEKNRQSSIDDLDQNTQDWWLEAQCAVADDAFQYYRMALEKGIAKECARVILPLGTETKLYMSGTIRSFLHYVELRTQEDTQQEHREIAESIKALMVEHLPIISEAMDWR